MGHTPNKQFISYLEIAKKFMIDEDYGTTDAFPSGIGAVIIASDVRYSFDPILEKYMYVHRNSAFQQHAEGHLIQQIRDDIEQLENNGKEVKQIDIGLFQNYSPCDDYQFGANGEKRGCASDIIEFKRSLEGSEKIVNIQITFANFYRWIGDCGDGPHNMAGLRKLRDAGVKLNLLQGKEIWKEFLHHDLVYLSDKEREDLLDRAASEERRQKEEKDTALWQAHILRIPKAPGDSPPHPLPPVQIPMLNHTNFKSWAHTVSSFRPQGSLPGGRG